MAGISSKALVFGEPENKKKYNGIEKEDALGIDVYDAQFRELDQQVGRWWQIDPKPDYAQSLYAAMGNNPIRFNDPLGDTLKVYVIDQKDRPTDKGTKGETYTADVYVYDTDNGSLSGPYSGSSFPNSKSNSDNSTSSNTLKEGTYDFNNKSGHKGGTKKGLNVINNKEERKAPGSKPDGTDVTMEYVNVHEGASDNGNYNSRG